MSSTAAERPRHFSMIRGFHLADFFTLANAACGVASIFCSMVYIARQATDSASLNYFFAAAALMPLALVFDIFDGRIARWRQAHSAMGRELDSLADIVSFGVAPAVLAFAAGMQGGWDCVALIYFVCCGVSRLARFNVTAETLSSGTDKVAYFEGTPMPTSVLLVGILALVAWAGGLGDGMSEGPGTELPGGLWAIGPWSLHPLVLLYVLSGSLMISKTLRIPKF